MTTWCPTPAFRLLPNETGCRDSARTSYVRRSRLLFPRSMNHLGRNAFRSLLPMMTIQESMSLFNLEPRVADSSTEYHSHVNLLPNHRCCVQIPRWHDIRALLPVLLMPLRYLLLRARFRVAIRWYQMLEEPILSYLPQTRGERSLCDGACLCKETPVWVLV